MSASPVSNVSDTARWVAVYRAWESARPDALFNDPYAKTLAGERADTYTGYQCALTILVAELILAAITFSCSSGSPQMSTWI